MHTQTKELYQILIASLVFLTIYMALFIRSIKRQMRQKLDEYRTQLTREIELIEIERARISADLHDELGSGLSAIGVLLSQLADGFKEHTLQKVSNYVLLQQQKIKEITYNLVPAVLQTHGLSMALEELFAEIAQYGKLRIHKNMRWNDSKYHSTKSIHLYRVIKELTTNTLKHAMASQITIDCFENDCIIRISYADNGKGFNLSKLSQTKGSGLRHIESRIKLLDATLEVISSNGNGCFYNFTIPIQSMLESHEYNK